MTRTSKLILGCYAALVALAFLWVPWTAPYPFKIEENAPEREVFVGYGWFWDGPHPQLPFDYVGAAREKWSINWPWPAARTPMRGLSNDEIRQLKAAIAIMATDSQYNQEKVQGIAYFIASLRPDIDLSNPNYAMGTLLEMPADVMGRAEKLHMEPGLLVIANRDQVLSWLKVKRNFDRTFPEKADMSQDDLVRFLDRWNAEWVRQSNRGYAMAVRPPGIKYSYIALEVLSLAMLAGATVALGQQIFPNL